MEMSDLFSLSMITFWLGIAIIVISIWQAISVADKPTERNFKLVTAVLAASLLCVQHMNDRRTKHDSDIQRKSDLDDQKQQITQTLTDAFKESSKQVILAAKQDAKDTRDAADSQTKAIESQASHQGAQLQDASLGSNICPTLMADNRAGQRPYALSVMNFDKSANIYDLVVYVGEGDHPDNGKQFRSLQDKTFRFPPIPPNASSIEMPFEFLSQRNTSYLQYSLSTRRKICSGQIVLHGDGNGNWYAEQYPVHEGPLTSHNTEVPMQDLPWNPSMIH